MISASGWYRVTMPASDCTTHGKARTMQDAFYALFAMNGYPHKAALFVSRDNRFQNYHFYFSPGAVEIARALIEGYSAEPCLAPVREEYRPVLLVGDPDARETLLPETE